MNLKKDNRGIGKSVIIIILAIVAALAIGGAIFAKNMVKKDPMARLIAGYMKICAQREERYSMDVSFSLDKENQEVKKLFEQIPTGTFKSSNEQLMDFVSKVLPKIGVKYTVMANTKEDPVSIGANMSLLYDSKELAGAGLTARPWEVTVFSNTLLDKPLYLDAKESVNNKAGVDISNIKLKDYFDVLYFQSVFLPDYSP